MNAQLTDRHGRIVQALWTEDWDLAVKLTEATTADGVISQLRDALAGINYRASDYDFARAVVEHFPTDHDNRVPALLVADAFEGWSDIDGNVEWIEYLGDSGDEAAHVVQCIGEQFLLADVIERQVTLEQLKVALDLLALDHDALALAGAVAGVRP